MKYKLKVNKENLELLYSIFQLYNFDDDNPQDLGDEIKYIEDYNPDYFYINGNHFCSYLITGLGEDRDKEYTEIKEIRICSLEKIKFIKLGDELVITNDVFISVKDKTIKFYEIIL